MTSIKEVYDETKTFVKENFGVLKLNDERITILAIMKMKIELMSLDIQRKKLATE